MTISTAITIGFWAGVASTLLMVCLPGYLHWRKQLRLAQRRPSAHE